jgi:hypothetical protein
VKGDSEHHTKTKLHFAQAKAPFLVQGEDSGVRFAQAGMFPDVVIVIYQLNRSRWLATGGFNVVFKFLMCLSDAA